jgi:diamine N-acetyltransferase
LTARLTSDRVDEALGMMERFYAEMDLPFARERARQALAELAGFGGWWFIEVEGKGVGYFVLTLGYSLEFGGRFALLDEFYVEREWRGKGLGAAAMERILEEAGAMGAAAVHLEAEGHVREFYLRSGFAVRGREMMTRWIRSS